jgi:hypothetical protein
VARFACLKYLQTEYQLRALSSECVSATISASLRKARRVRIGRLGCTAIQKVREGYPECRRDTGIDVGKTAIQDKRTMSKSLSRIMRCYTRFSATVISLAMFTALLQAQSTGTKANQASDATASRQVQVTGCLRRGSSGTYYLSAQDGEKWQLSSTTVDLAQHVMHSVAVIGTPGQAMQSKIGRKPEGDGQSGVNGARPLEVLSLKMLSPSCTR